jgi:hypothetical protein
MRISGTPAIGFVLTTTSGSEASKARQEGYRVKEFRKDGWWIYEHTGKRFAKYEDAQVAQQNLM